MARQYKNNAFLGSPGFAAKGAGFGVRVCVRSHPKPVLSTSKDPGIYQGMFQ